MPVLFAFITEELDFSPSYLVLEDGCVLSRWFRGLTWGGLMEVDRSLKCQKSATYFSSSVFSLPLMQRTREYALVIWTAVGQGLEK